MDSFVPDHPGISSFRETCGDLAVFAEFCKASRRHCQLAELMTFWACIPIVRLEWHG
jgi:hypothetical protein